MDELHRAALRAAVLRHIAFISYDLETALLQCGSPPERAMLHALAIVAWDWGDGVLFRTEFGASGLVATKGMWVEIEPQAQVGACRVDFLLTCRLRDPPASAKLVVECDGHEWHERTREQAQRDGARDRYLQSNDLAVYRYTGAEVWKDVFAAAYEAVSEPHAPVRRGLRARQALIQARLDLGVKAG